MTAPLVAPRRVPRLPAGDRVLLVGLSPVYAHGLARVLTSAGLACTVVPAVEQLPPYADAAVVAVAPVALAPALRPPAGEDVALVLVLEGDAPQDYVRGLRAGAVGLLSPYAEPEDTVGVVRLAARGTTALPHRVALTLLPPACAPAPALSDVERSWLRQLARQATVARLARSSGYSQREMYRLLSALYARLGATSRTEALLRAQQWRLLDDG